MNRLLRSLQHGSLSGWVLDVLILLFFPHFFGRFIELLLFPAVGAGLFAAVHGLVAVLRWTLRTRRGTRGLDATKAPSLRARRRIAAYAGVLVITLGLYALRWPARSWMVEPRVLVFCVDGATWDLIDPLAARDELPSFSRLVREGTSGVLLSSETSFSPVVWTTMATGLKPDEHGITSFYSTQNNLKAKRIWEILDSHGLTVGIFRWLVTWPPRPVQGFLIPDILARDASCYPPDYEFINQLRIDRKTDVRISAGRAAGYVFRYLRSGLRLESCLAIAGELGRAEIHPSPAARHVALRRSEIRLNRDVYAHLLRRTRPEFTTFYDNGVDVLSHYYWQYMEPDLFPEVRAEESRRYGTLITDYYRLVDEVLESLLDHLGPATSVFVMSDHGLAADPEAGEGRMYPLVEPILQALGLEDEFYGIALGARTYIESVEVEPGPRAEALARALRRVSAAVDSRTGAPVFIATLEADERILLEVAENVPSPDVEVRVDAETYPLKNWVTLKPSHTGKHDPEGILLAWGPEVAEGRTITGATILDVAPTLLYAMGMPVSRELQGSILLDLFNESFRAAHEIAWIDSYGPVTPILDEVEVDEETRKKLEALGYVR